MEEGDKGKKNMSERKGVKGEDMKESIAHCLKEKRTVYDWKANEYLLVMAIVQMH
jgi:ribonucleotide reductase alpha subunit